MVQERFRAFFFAGRLQGLLWLFVLSGWQARPVEGSTGSAWQAPLSDVALAGVRTQVARATAAGSAL